VLVEDIAVPQTSGQRGEFPHTVIQALLAARQHLGWWNRRFEREHSVLLDKSGQVWYESPLQYI
jgi:hypothetical protein